MGLPARYRAGLLLVGIVMAAPLLTSGAATARDMTITFSGEPLFGLSTLACPSTPSRTTLTVTVGTTVNFVNRTGRTATVWAGDSQKDLPDKSLVPVTFMQGPATVVVQMLPKCSLDLGKHARMTVTVVAAGGSSLITNPSPGISPLGPGGDGNVLAASPAGGPARSMVFGQTKGPELPRSASGLLTLIATVGIVGVAAAAIRAIIAQRASKALIT